MDFDTVAFSSFGVLGAFLAWSYWEGGSQGMAAVCFLFAALMVGIVALSRGRGW